VSARSERASAPGKAILVGEHAVVYGRPALAVPVSDVRARATVRTGSVGQGLVIRATDMGMMVSLHESDGGAAAVPLRLTVTNTLDLLKVDPNPDLVLELSSQIPIARGMGSGPAVATAIVRALCTWYDHGLSDQAISDLVYETEVVLHGTPSGIDNTVVAYERPVYFCRNTDGPPHEMRTLSVGSPLLLVIADTGLGASTREAIDRVRAAWEADKATYEAMFDQIGGLVETSRQAIAQGDVETLGEQMNDNQTILQQLGVSNGALDHLVSVARRAGALGAKLSGGGLGGCMIALACDEDAQRVVSEALRCARASQVFATTVRSTTMDATGTVPSA